MIERLRCVVCGVTDTPLWRSGPKGPKTLCNACGVRWKKGKLYIDGKQASPPHHLIDKTRQKQARVEKITSSLNPRVLSRYISDENCDGTKVSESDTSKYEAFLKTPTAASIAYAASKSIRTNFRNKLVVASDKTEGTKGSTSCLNVDSVLPVSEKETRCWYLSGLYAECDEEMETSPALIELDTDSLADEEICPQLKDSNWAHQRREKSKRWNSFSKRNSIPTFLKWRKDSKRMRRQTEYKFGLLLDAAKAVGMGV